VLDEVHCLRTGTLGSYMGRRDLWLRALSWGTHLSLCAYYVSESAWWLLQTCPELDMALGPGGRWLRRWDGEGTWSGRLERWFNWPLERLCDLPRQLAVSSVQRVRLCAGVAGPAATARL
jgi:hypothetical protein